MSATIYTILMAVAFSMSGIFLIVAVILFFKLRLKMVIEELSGRRARKQVAEIRKENTSTKSRGYVPEIFGDNDNNKPVVSNSKEEAKKRITEMLAASNKEDKEESGGTVLLTEDLAGDEREEGTTVLGMNNDDSEGTTILVEEDEGTTLLNVQEEPSSVECKVLRAILIAESKEYLKVE